MSHGQVAILVFVIAIVVVVLTIAVPRAEKYESQIFGVLFVAISLLLVYGLWA